MKTILTAAALWLITGFGFTHTVLAQPYKAGSNSSYSMSELNRTGTTIQDVRKQVSKSIEIAPNPITAGQSLRIRPRNVDLHEMHWRLLTLNGSVVLEAPELHDGKFLALPADLPAGVYLIRATDQKRVYSRRLVVLR